VRLIKNELVLPTDYDLLKTYDRNLEDIVALGWGIFGWINRHAFIPMFSF
jgi:YidC/Oxa1 family membrane protein insertase